MFFLTAGSLLRSWDLLLRSSRRAEARKPNYRATIWVYNENHHVPTFTFSPFISTVFIIKSTPIVAPWPGGKSPWKKSFVNKFCSKARLPLGVPIPASPLPGSPDTYFYHLHRTPLKELHWKVWLLSLLLQVVGTGSGELCMLTHPHSTHWMKPHNLLPPLMGS